MVVAREQRRERKRLYNRGWYHKNPERGRAKSRKGARIRRWIHHMDAVVYKGGICVNCGYKDNLNALEFDHMKPALRGPVSTLLLCKWEIIKAELDRCELVCANCHAIRTATRRENQRRE